MSNQYFDKVKEYILDLGYTIDHEDVEDGMFMISDEDSGIYHLVVGIADPLLILEQFIFEIKHESIDLYKSLLQKNRDIVHGAFVIDDSGKRVIYRDTLQIENLDLNELEGSLNSLALLLSEYSEELLAFSNN
ncbi:MAG: molecular chaperone Tir [Bacteroidia bacterium]